MTSHPAHTAALPAAACLLCVGCSLPQLTPASPPPTRQPSPAHATAKASPPPEVAPALRAILPFSPARLEAAAELAGRFTAYDTWSWQQPPAAWLAALRPMTTSGLRVALARAVTVPGALAQREATRQAATAAPTTEKIRNLSPGSVTITVTVWQVFTSTTGTSHTPDSFAVTLTPQGSSWAVYDIEPAAAGNS